ncbi:expressed unknown protein [Seminavis robusta]|uniref:Chitin-binding type-2 domain-containing protein n=1 Tax=Seminavis robusta TaxID=568900 RepID=A0A9N8DH64_9STRA|nr:expressed unknown protein [Seminavis robusta]|eukprot:Sro150_g068920.1 n/a (566) ;mRNA; f:80703-82400
MKVSLIWFQWFLLLAGFTGVKVIHGQDEDVDGSDYDYGDYYGGSGPNLPGSTGSALPDVTLVAVNCSDDLVEFTALTEMLLEGSSDLLPLLDRKVLKGEFMGIYNSLTALNCDAYHRKLNRVNFVAQFNGTDYYTLQDLIYYNESLNVNQTKALEDWFTPDQNGTGTDQDGDQEDADLNNTRRAARRILQIQNEVSTNTTNSSGDRESSDYMGSVTVMYQTVGTCRGCPVTDAGSFELYDDAFRRRLATSKDMQMRRINPVQLKTRILSTRKLQQDYNSTDTRPDCRCPEGSIPRPQAPGVQECIDLMNERIPVVQQELGVLRNSVLVNLIQLDDLSTIDDDNATETESAGTIPDTSNSGNGSYQPPGIRPLPPGPPPSDPNNNNNIGLCCPTGYTGVLPHNNCAQFYNCEFGQVVDQAPIPCPQGLLFDRNQQVCTWPAVVSCTENPVCISRQNGLQLIQQQQQKQKEGNHPALEYNIWTRQGRPNDSSSAKPKTTQNVRNNNKDGPSTNQETTPNGVDGMEPHSLVHMDSYEGKSKGVPRQQASHLVMMIATIIATTMLLWWG